MKVMGVRLKFEKMIFVVNCLTDFDEKKNVMTFNGTISRKNYEIIQSKKHEKKFFFRFFLNRMCLMHYHHFFPK